MIFCQSVMLTICVALCFLSGMWAGAGYTGDKWKDRLKAKGILKHDEKTGELVWTDSGEAAP